MRKSLLAVALVVPLVGGGAVAVAAGADAAACTYPAEVLDLAEWKVTLPTGDDEDPTEITQPELGEFVADPWFVPTAECDGVQFRAAVDGVTTGGSSYPRAELREMTDGGSDEASWSATEGTHTMVVTAAINAVPNDKPEVVAAQIHDSSDDVTAFRLEGDELWITEDDETNHHLIIDDYELGTPFEAKYVVSDGEIEIYFDGELQTTVEADFGGGYFKTGAYTQANCENSDPCDSDNFGQVTLYDVTVTHS